MMRTILWWFIAQTEQYAEVALVKWLRGPVLRWLAGHINARLQQPGVEPPKVEQAGNLKDALSQVSAHNMDPQSSVNDASPKSVIHNSDDVSTPVDIKKP